MQFSDIFNHMDTCRVRSSQQISVKTDLFIAFDATLAALEGRGGEGREKEDLKIIVVWDLADLIPYTSGLSCSKVGERYPPDKY